MRRLLTLLLMSASTAAAAAGGARAASFVYAGNGYGGASDSISEFAAGTGGLLTPLAPASVTLGADPVGAVVSPDGRHLYAALQDGAIAQYAIGADGALQPLSPPTVSAGGGIESFGMAESPDGRHVYVSTYDGTTSGVAQLAVAADGTLQPMSPPLVAADSSWGVAVDAASRHVYVVDAGGIGGVWQFAIGSDGALKPLDPPEVAAGFKPSAIAIAPDGRHAYVAENAHDLLQYAVGEDGTLAPLSPPSVATSDYPVSVTVSPDGRSVYATQVDGVSQFDVGADGALAPKGTPKVAAGTLPWGIAMSPDGRTVYTTDQQSGGTSAVWQFGAGAGGLLQALSPGAVDGAARPVALAVTPDPSPTAAFSVHAAPPGGTTTFDGGGSSAPSGQVARYDWDFGDGATQPGGPATTSHVYASPGTYTATLTVTDSNGCSATPISAGQGVYCPGSAAARARQSVIVAAPALAPGPVAPVANAVVTRGRRTRRGQTFRFDARLSVVERGRIVAYAWRVGGRTISRRATFSRFFSSARSAYRVTLTVRSDAGLSASTVVTVRPRAVQAPALRVTLPAGVTYCVDCAQPSPRAAAVVRRLRRYARGAARVEIDSYADATGTRAYNLALTRRRAQAIAHLLLRGVSPRPRRVVLRAFGEAHPVAPNGTPAGRARNRRTVVTIVPGPLASG